MLIIPVDSFLSIIIGYYGLVFSLVDLFVLCLQQLESTAMSHQILLQSTAPSSAKSDSSVKPKKSGSSKKKKKIVGAKKKCPAKYEPTRHYRVNLAEIPFVAGKVCMFI